MDNTSQTKALRERVRFLEASLSTTEALLRLETRRADVLQGTFDRIDAERARRLAPVAGGATAEHMASRKYIPITAAYNQDDADAAYNEWIDRAHLMDDR